MSSNGSSLIDVPLVGMSEVQNADNGGYSYSESLVQTAQNEWQPTGPLVEPPTYALSLYSSEVAAQPATYVQSPDVLLFKDKTDYYALNFEKLYQPSSDGNTLRNPTPNTPTNLYNQVGTALSYQTPVETRSQKIFDFTTNPGPCTFLHSLQCFASYYFGDVTDKTGVVRVFTGLTFYDKYTGKKLNSQWAEFGTIQNLGIYSNTTLTIPYKSFVTEDIDGNIGVLGFSLSAPNQFRAQEYSLLCKRKTLPDKTLRIDANEIVATSTFVANLDGEIIGYYSILSEDQTAIIDIIAINGQTSGLTTLQLVSRRNRTIVSQLSYAPTSFTGYGTLFGSVFISDYTNDVIFSYAYTENTSTDTGATYRLLTIDKTTGAISFNGAEVNIVNEAKTTGTYFNAFGIYNFRSYPNSFSPTIVIQKELTGGNILTSEYDTFRPSFKYKIIKEMPNAIISTQPVPVENSFFCQLSWRPRDVEFGQAYLQIVNYQSTYSLDNPLRDTVFYNVSGVMGYNVTYCPAYVQSGYCKDTRLICAVANSEDATYVRSSQIGLCESLRPVQFNGDTYVFCGFNYLVSASSGLQRLGVYTTPKFTLSFLGGGTTTGTFTFRCAYASFGSPGPVSNPQSITVTSAQNISVTLERNFLDYPKNPNTVDTLKYIVKVYVLKPSDGLYYEISNPVAILTFLDSTSEIAFNVAGGITYGNLAEFETGEAPNVGLNSPCLAAAALGRVVCSDEFGEKIYTSKQVDETTYLEFSDVLFINSPPTASRITELQEINNTLVCFSESSIYGINGSLPDSFGNQSLSQWQVISSVAGCTSAAPTLTTDKGVYFCDTSGIFRLNRGLFVEAITPYRGFVPNETPTLTQDFWWHSSSQDGTSNLFFSTSSARTRLNELDFTLPYDIIDSVYVYNEDFNTFGCWSADPSLPGSIYSVSGLLGGAIMTSEATNLLAPILGNNEGMANPVYDTGYICPFGPYTYGTVVAVYLKLFRVGDIPDSYPAGLEPIITVIVRDDKESQEEHFTTQTMEDPKPENNRQTFLWRVRLTNRRCNSIRIIANLGLWGIRGLCLEVLPQPVGGVQRRVQGITQ